MLIRIFTASGTVSVTVEVLDLVKVDEVCTSFFVEGEGLVYSVSRRSFGGVKFKFRVYECFWKRIAFVY